MACGAWNHQFIFSILSSVVQGVLGPGRVVGPYALDIGRKWTLSKQLLAYCSPDEKVLLGEEGDRCEQNIIKHLLAESAVIFGSIKVINA